MKCNICGSKEFIDMNRRKSVRCSQCNSLERTRVIALYIQHLKLLNKNTRILHIAPEKGLGEYLYGIASTNCIFADIEPKKYLYLPNTVKMDLCSDLENVPSKSFDLIIHSHVMEHILCNYTYVLYHLHRIMSINGRIVCSIPFLSGFYDCCTSPKLSDQDRQKRFGQDDHVRRYGTEDLHMSIGKIYNLTDEYDITKHFPEEKLIEYNIPRYVWKGYTPSTVLCLKKEDFLLK